MVYLTPTLEKYLQQIRSWRFLTRKMLSLLFNCSEKTAKKNVDWLLAENLIVEPGAATGPKGSWLQGKWLTTRHRLARIKKRKYRGCVKTSRGFEVPAHQLIVPHTIAWVLKQVPDVKFIPEFSLRYDHGWYWQKSPKYLRDGVTPFANYVPDALGVYGETNFRLEVQLSKVPRNFFDDMIRACRDKHPILLTCYPGRKDYFLNLTSNYGDRIAVVELHDDINLQRVFGG